MPLALLELGLLVGSSGRQCEELYHPKYLLVHIFHGNEIALVVALEASVDSLPNRKSLEDVGEVERDAFVESKVWEHLDDQFETIS